MLFEERIGLLRDFCKSMDELFEAFLKIRTSGAWEGQGGDDSKVDSEKRQATSGSHCLIGLHLAIQTG